MSFYARDFGLSVPARTMVAPRTAFSPAAAAPPPPPPPSNLTAHSATSDQIAAAFEWYGLTVRPPGGFVDVDTLTAVENHVADLLNLKPTSKTIAAAQQAASDAQAHVQSAQLAVNALAVANPNGSDYNNAVAALNAAQAAVGPAQSKVSAYQSAQLGNQITVVNLALAHSPRIAQALQASGDVPAPPPPAPPPAAPPPVQQQAAAQSQVPMSQQSADTAGPTPVSFMDQYGTLVIAGGAAVVMVGLGIMLLKKPRKKMAGYRRRRRR